MYFTKDLYYHPCLLSFIIDNLLTATCSAIVFLGNKSGFLSWRCMPPCPKFQAIDNTLGRKRRVLHFTG